MCGRFVSSTPPDQLADYFDVEAVPEQLLDRGPTYNTAPTTGVLVVHSDGSLRHLESFRWGLVPSWAKDVSVGNRMINARAETVASKPAYRKAFARRRCIIPADGFYEWTTAPGSRKKQPYFIHRPDGEPFAFAGLWERWKGPKQSTTAEAPDPELPVAEPLRSCTIITTSANDKMSELHDRMPVILPRSAWDDWLSPDVDDLDLLGSLLVPAPSELIAFHPVSTDVNNVRNKGAQLTEPAPAPEPGEPESADQQLPLNSA
jgi:putative SOS response-associated peptidase YedK